MVLTRLLILLVIAVLPLAGCAKDRIEDIGPLEMYVKGLTHTNKTHFNITFFIGNPTNESIEKLHISVRPGSFVQASRALPQPGHRFPPWSDGRIRSEADFVLEPGASILWDEWYYYPYPKQIMEHDLTIMHVYVEYLHAGWKYFYAFDSCWNDQGERVVRFECAKVSIDKPVRVAPSP